MKEISFLLSILNYINMLSQRIGVLPFRKFEGKLQVGSSTIRCDWLVKHWPEAEEFRYGQPYDVIIYQKAYWPEHAKLVEGVKILDICDADWFHWGYRTKEMIGEVDAITCSSWLLTKAIRNFTNKPVVYIPDRLDLDIFKPIEVKDRQAKKIGWFGYSHNFFALHPAIVHLIKLDLELLVLSEKEYHPPSGYDKKIEYKTLGFDWDTLREDFSDIDMVLNPRSDKGKWAYKSDNKTSISRALGLPVAFTPADITKFMDPEARRNESKIGLKEVKEKRDVNISIIQYKELIKKINKQKNG